MSNQSSSQLELFSQGKEYNERKPAIGSSFLRRLWVYEKTILFSLGFIITAIVAFSLGVEKGKSLTQAQSSRTKIIQSQKQPLVETRPQEVISRPDAVIPQKPRENLQNYTIQLASYKSKSYAQKEAEALKKKGLSPSIISRGGYSVLCVGRFSDKENARALLSKLEKKYQGCFIRRI